MASIFVLATCLVTTILIRKEMKKKRCILIILGEPQECRELRESNYLHRYFFKKFLEMREAQINSDRDIISSSLHIL